MTLADLGLPPITFHKAAHYTEGRTEPIRAFVNHRMVGTLPGTTAYFQNPETRPVSTHFGIGKVNGVLQIHQYVPLDDTAYGNGNYDPSGMWDNWGYKTTEINPQTISIEHQDHWGDPNLKGIVPLDVREASQKLQALIRYGTISQWREAGLTVRDWGTNAPIIHKELSAIPVNRSHILTHKDIAGRLKPFCWAPWEKDIVGYPREEYVGGILAYAAVLAKAEPAPASATFTQEQMDAAIAAAIAAPRAEADALRSKIEAAVVSLNKTLADLA